MKDLISNSGFSIEAKLYISSVDLAVEDVSCLRFSEVSWRRRLNSELFKGFFRHFEYPFVGFLRILALKCGLFLHLLSRSSRSLLKLRRQRVGNNRIATKVRLVSF